MKCAYTNIEEKRMYIAVMQENATIASLMRRFDNGETVEHVVLKDEAGHLNGVVALNDVLEFLIPYMLFLDSDVDSGIVESLGKVTLKTLARDIHSIALKDFGMPGAGEELFTTFADTEGFVADMKDIPAKMVCNRLLLRFLHSREEDFYAVS